MAITANLDQTAVVGAEPHGAVARAMTGHHDVRGKAAARLVVDLRLSRLGHVFDDTAVVGTEPVVALGVLRGGVDVAQFQGAESGEGLDILVQAVAIARDPHVAAAVSHQVLHGVVAQRGLVELVVLELFHLLALGVDHEESLMVGGYPYPAALVGHHVPYLHGFWQCGEAVGLEEGVHRGEPLLGSLVVDEGAHVGHHPVVAVMVDDEVIGIIVLAAMFGHVSVLPFHLARSGIHPDEFTVAGCHEQHAVVVGHRREIEFLGQHPFLVAVFGQRVLPPARHVAVETLVVGLHPDVSLRVDVETVDVADNSVGLELPGRVPLGALGGWVEQRVVHALAQPEPSHGVFEDLVYVVVAQGRGVIGV